MSFKQDYEHWKDNRKHYKGIHPIHSERQWEVSVMDRGTKLGGKTQTLEQAKEAVNTFRQSAGEG